MKKLVYLAMLLIATTSNAQQANVTWGPLSKTDTKFAAIVRGENNEMIKLSFLVSGGMFSKKRETPVLTRYDNKMNEIASKEYTADEDGMSFDNLLSLKNKIYLFTSKYEKSDKTTAYYAQRININTLNPEGKVIALGSFTAVSKYNQSTVKFEPSADSSKLLMFGLTPYNRKENEKYYMSIYDLELNKLWENTVELPYLDKFVDVIDYFVTNDAEVGVLLKHYDQEVKKEAIKVDGTKVPSYKTKLLTYAKGTAKPQEFVLNIGDKFVHELKLTADENNNLNLFGLYKNKYNGHVNGFFTTQIDRVTKQVTQKKLEAFPEELIAAVKVDKQASEKEKDPGLYANFNVYDVVKRNNGSIDYILQYYAKIQRERSSNNSMFSTIYYEYVYGDIIVVNVASNTKTTITRIPKMQSTSPFDLTNGFKSTTYKNKLVLFYNDDKDNIDKDLSKKPESFTRPGKSSFVMCVVDENGTFTRQELFSNRELPVTVCPMRSYNITPAKISLYAQKIGMAIGTKDMLGVIELK
jgi:hypothetical protein